MTTSRLQASKQDETGDTNVSELIARNLHALSWRLRKQMISWHVDVDPAICFPMDGRQISEVLEMLIVDALRSMPEGGSLDVTVIATFDSLEIEVADSGFEASPLPGLRVFPSDQPLSPRQSRTVWVDGVRVEVLPCPQGGNARTICVPRGPARAAA